MDDSHLDSRITKPAFVNLHVYTYNFGSGVFNDLDDVLQGATTWEQGKHYDIAGLRFEVTHKNRAAITVLVTLPTSNLAANLIYTARGRRRMLIQGQMEAERYKQGEAKDNFKQRE